MSDQNCPAGANPPQAEPSQQTFPANVGVNGQVTQQHKEGNPGQKEYRRYNRHEGGQPGNQNARKHGFYSKAIPPELRQKLYDASNLKGLDEEIALLQAKIAIAAENSVDYRHLVPGFALLQKFVNANKKLCPDADDTLQNAFAQAWAKILPPGISDPAEAYRILSEYLKSVSPLPPSGNHAKKVENSQTTQIDYANEAKVYGCTTNDSASV